MLLCASYFGLRKTIFSKLENQYCPINVPVFMCWLVLTHMEIGEFPYFVCFISIHLTLEFLFSNALEFFKFNLRLFSGISLFGAVFVILFLPETKGKSLEEIEMLFQ